MPVRSRRGLEEDDLIPDYLLTAPGAAGSAADNNAIASWKDGDSTMVLIRPLGLANDDDKSLKEGGVYNIGFGMHDDNIATRGHPGAFVRTMGSAPRRIEAVELP